MLRLPYITSFISVSTLLFGNVSLAQPALVLGSPGDNFSKNFVDICNDAPSMFADTKGRLHKKGDVLHYTCRKRLKGAQASYITGDKDATCVFYYGSFKTLPDAEEYMEKLHDQIKTALLKQVLERTVDSSDDPLFVKGIAIAEIIDDGFYDYNIRINIDRTADSTRPYAVLLKVKSYTGNFYRFVFKNAPHRSPEFYRSFSKLYSQFDGDGPYVCNDMLPGFTCTTVDSAGKQQVLLEKRLIDFPDARVEFECLTTNIRAILGMGNFLYYLPPTNDEVIRATVFVRFDDYDKIDRKSITTSLMKNNDGGFSVKVLMYHP